MSTTGLDKMSSDLGGYVAAPIIYLVVWLSHGMLMDAARVTTLLLFEIHFGEIFQHLSIMLTAIVQ